MHSSSSIEVKIQSVTGFGASRYFFMLLVGLSVLLASGETWPSKDKSWPGDNLVHQALDAQRAGDLDETIALYLRAVELGNPIAMNNLGILYQRGTGVAKDQAAASEWFRQGAELGYVLAMYSLGIAYRYGRGLPQNEKLGVSWLKKAAKLDDYDARNELKKKAPEPGYHENTLGNAANQRGELVKALEHWTAAAEAGNKYAMNSIGSAYYLGKGVLVNFTLAFEWYEKAAKAGDSDGYTNMAMVYRFGNGKERNEEEALKLYRKAEKLGSEAAAQGLKAAPPDRPVTETDLNLLRAGEAATAGDIEQAVALWQQAQTSVAGVYNMGYAYLHGLAVEKDLATAAKYFKRSASTGHEGSLYFLNIIANELADPELMVALGQLYLEDDGVDIDGWVARDWFQRAALLGYAPAEEKLSALTPTPEGGDEELQQAHNHFSDKYAAFPYYLKAAAKGNVQAMNALGDAYVNGDGTSIDHEAARLWFGRSARAGSAYGQQNYAALLALGLGGPQDGPNALLWYQLAAESGNTMAMFGLGKMYAQGMGIPKDDAMAIEWYTVCAANGSPRCERTLADRGLIPDRWKAREEEVRAIAARKQQEQEQNRRAYQENLSRIWAYSMNGQTLAEFGAASRERSECLQRVTDSIRGQTYGQQSWSYKNNC